jgi:hypothetical protein
MEVWHKAILTAANATDERRRANEMKEAERIISRIWYALNAILPLQSMLQF